LESSVLFDKSVFTDEELVVLDTVYTHFRTMSACQISELSHQEDVWQKYNDSKQTMDFNMAFS
jgi:uncharacterized phage-associated protein